jgi:crotonobetainyl-CoA:carnitine CoA-transferase CaiB-like acyl-CoA transferase
MTRPTHGLNATRSSLGSEAAEGEETTSEWLDLFSRNDMWAGPVYGYSDPVADPQVAHNGTLVEYDHPTEARIKTPGLPLQVFQDTHQG